MLRASSGVLRHTLLSALGLLPIACGGSSTGSPGTAGAPTTGGTAATGGSATTAGSGGAAGSGGQLTGGAGTATGGVPTAGSGGNAAGGTAGTAGTETGTPPFPCEDSVSLAGASPGYAMCDGVWHRPEIKDCAAGTTEQPRPPGEECTKDADCTENQICVCGPYNRCAEAKCKVDADCSPGFVCRGYSAGGCDGPGFVAPSHFTCQTGRDVCATAAECDGMRCGAASGSFQCDVPPPSPACGRPFLVQGAARVAELQPRTDWRLGPLSVEEGPPGAPLRERAGMAWARIAQLEHASVAAFARFTLQLLQLGAPAELVERATRALQDETRHAQLAFTLASDFMGKPLGPAALNVAESLGDGSLAAVVRLVMREGCVGETVAALQAREAAAHVDGALRNVLEGIANDESEHAELAWRFVRWALEQDRSLWAVVQEELSLVRAELASAPITTSAEDEALLVFGILPSALERTVRYAALREVVEPCGLALLSSASPEASERLAEVTLA